MDQDGHSFIDHVPELARPWRWRVLDPGLSILGLREKGFVSGDFEGWEDTYTAAIEAARAIYCQTHDEPGAMIYTHSWQAVKYLLDHPEEDR